MGKIFKIGYKVLGVGLIAYALIYGLMATLPQLPTIGQSSRNVFYHVPMWFAEVVLMLISVIYSIRFLLLINPDSESKIDPIRMDIKAREAARIGVMFNVAGLVTGIIWSRVSWGQNLASSDFNAWWVWDPVQICALVGLLIYLGYFLLRSSISEPTQRGKIAAVFNIFAFMVLIPLFFIVPRMLPGLHPTAEGESTGLFDTKNITNIYRLILYPSALGFILFSCWMMEVRNRLELANARLQNLMADRAFRRKEKN